MSCCLGVLLPAGLVLAADSGAREGADQAGAVALAQRLWIFEVPGERVIALAAAGPLAAAQAVVAALREGADTGDEPRDLHAVPSLLDAAGIVGLQLAAAVRGPHAGRDDGPVPPRSLASSAFLVGGQIAGGPPRLFHVDAAGRVEEASSRSRQLQIGSASPARLLFDRVLTRHSSLEEAAKLCLLSFDASLRLDGGVAAPIDLLRYATDSFGAANLVTIEQGDPYWQALRSAHDAGLCRLSREHRTPPAKPRGRPGATRTEPTASSRRT